MTEELFAARIDEARRKIESLPENEREPLMRLLDETFQRQAGLKVSFSRIRQLLDDWRMRMKYMAFDLEATKRELAELRRKHGDNNV